MNAPPVDHCCVACGRCVVKADAPIETRMTARCPACGEVRELRAEQPTVLFRRYRCGDCGFSPEAALPRHRATFCGRCGKDGTLEIIEETVAPREPVPARVKR